jgi:hypothetical protein
MLRAAGATGIDMATFQEDFDLDLAGGQPKNNFHSVAEAIKAKYPNVDFAEESFRTGAEKLSRLEELLEQGMVVAVSLNLLPIKQVNGWHIMPVVEWDDRSIGMLNGIISGVPDIWTIKKTDFVLIHDNFPGGKEIAYLSKWK